MMDFACNICHRTVSPRCFVYASRLYHTECAEKEGLLMPLAPDPVPMRLHCPECLALHLDVGEFATKPHHTHACQECGNVWRPAVVATVGVRFLPGFKNEAP